MVMSCGTPDDAGSGGFGGAQRQHAPACLKKKKSIYCAWDFAVHTALVIRRGWLQGVRPAPTGECWQKAGKPDCPCLEVGEVEMVSPPAMRQGVPQHPGAAGYGIYVPRGNAKALKENCVYGL